MAVEIKSNRAFQGDPARLPSPLAPMPADAVLYADFRDRVFVSQANRSADASLVFAPLNIGNGFHYSGAGQLAYAANNTFDRIDHDPQTGEALGLLLETVVHNYIASAQRQDLRNATALNCTVSRVADLEDDFTEWFLLSGVFETETKALTFTGPTVFNTQSLMWQIEAALGPGSARYIQLGVNSGDARDYVNFDLEEGVVTATGWREVYGYMTPTRDGWRCWITCDCVTNSAAMDPYVAIVDTPDAGRLEATIASGGMIQLRSPHAANETPDLPAAVPMTFPFPRTATDTRPSDSLRMQEALIPPAGDFSAVFRMAAPEWNSPCTRSAFCLYVSSVAGITLRANAIGTWELVEGTDNVLHEFNAVLIPRRVYRFGISRDAQRIRVNLDGEEVSFQDPDVAAGTPRIGRGLGAVAGGWGGHLQRVIAWDGPAPHAVLRQRLARLV